VVSINKSVAVTLMRAEQARLKWTGNRPGTVDADASGSESDADGDGGGGAGDEDGDEDEDMLEGGDRCAGGTESRTYGDGGHGRLGDHARAPDTQDGGDALAVDGGARGLSVGSAQGVALDVCGVSEQAPAPTRRIRTVG